MNKMTNRITAAILASALISFTANAMAEDPVNKSPRKGQHHHRANQQMPVVDQMMRAVRHLDLSDEQKTGIRVIMKDLKAQDRAQMKEMRAMHAQLRELIKADAFDETAAAALAEKEGDLAANRLLSTSRSMSRVYAQLTGEQRAELEAMAEQRQAKRAERRKQRSLES
jgi:protein CpxP